MFSLQMDLCNCHCDLDVQSALELFRASLETTGLAIVSLNHHDFASPAGAVTGIAILKESHAAFSTWPEERLCCVDLFSCNDSVDFVQFVAVWIIAMRPTTAAFSITRRPVNEKELSKR